MWSLGFVNKGVFHWNINENIDVLGHYITRLLNILIGKMAHNNGFFRMMKLNISHILPGQKKGGKFCLYTINFL